MEKLFVKKTTEYPHEMFRQEFFKIGEKCFFADFFVPEQRLIIEVDGRQYHRGRERGDNDFIRDALFERIGLKAVHFPDREITDKDFYQKYFLPKIESMLSGKSNIVDYYDTPDANKFDGVNTRFQEYFSRLICELEELEPDSEIIVDTNETYIFGFLLDRKLGKDAKNKDLRQRINDLMDAKNIKIGVNFIGNTKNAKPWVFDEYKKARKYCDKMQFVVKRVRLAGQNRNNNNL